MCSHLLSHWFTLNVDANAAASQANREEIDSRSVFVGNVSSLFPSGLSFQFPSARLFVHRLQ